MLRKRRRVCATRHVPAAASSDWVEPRCYERDCVRKAWKDLWLGGA